MHGWGVGPGGRALAGSAAGFGQGGAGPWWSCAVVPRGRCRLQPAGPRGRTCRNAVVGSFGVATPVAGSSPVRADDLPSACSWAPGCDGGRLRLTRATPGLATCPDRDDLGVTHDDPLLVESVPRRGRFRWPARGPRRRPGLSEEAKSAKVSGVVNFGSKPRTFRIREVSRPRPKVRKATCSGEKSASRVCLIAARGRQGEAGQREGGPADAAYGLAKGEHPVAGHVERARHVGDRGVLERRRAGRSSWTNCSRGLKPRTVGITGSRK